MKKTPLKRDEDYKPIVDAYIKRLCDVAGFKYVTQKPPLMRSANKAPLYYLIFASTNKVAHRIASHIFKKYQQHT